MALLNVKHHLFDNSGEGEGGLVRLADGGLQVLTEVHGFDPKATCDGFGNFALAHLTVVDVQGSGAAFPRPAAIVGEVEPHMHFARG